MGYLVDGDKSYLGVSYFDDVDDAQMFQCLDAVFAVPGYQEKDFLVDYSGVTKYGVTMPTVARLSEITNAHIVEHGPLLGRMACIVPKDVEYGMTRAFMAYLSSAKNMRLFRRRAEALAWLGIAEEGEFPDTG